jgi:hypothetical protein
MLLRHLLAGGATVAVVMVAVVVITTPFVAVFLLDESLTLSNFAKMYAESMAWYIFWVSVGTVAVMPIAMALERFTMRGGRLRVALAVLLPFVLVAAMVGCVYAAFKYFLDSPGAYHTVAIAFGLMFLFVLYWPMLWLLNLVGYALTRLYRRLRRARPAPAAPAERAAVPTGIHG